MKELSQPAKGLLYELQSELKDVIKTLQGLKKALDCAAKAMEPLSVETTYGIVKRIESLTFHLDNFMDVKADWKIHGSGDGRDGRFMAWTPR